MYINIFIIYANYNAVDLLKSLEYYIINISNNDNGVVITLLK